ncbi:S-layer homology domain-containing protein [Lysinibacillus boronitolerans]|uniref:S-layer homology domain-containing protein n=1 Tax=Lysinibacillus boronitolerans TaxID=309788 RepID=UPI0028A07420|nr:S-layer homology domain-containing protein [Lysinibacillus boronitolerans]
MAKQNKGRKFFAASATAALVASAIVPVASAAQVNDYNKISGYAKEAVQSLVDQGVIQGDTNGNFNPLNTVTRAQAAEIFTKALELEADGEVNFKDVKAGAWYYNSIAAVVANGIFEGVSATEFAPNKSLTRSEAAKVLVDAFGLEGSESLGQFADASQVKPWAKSALETAVANGIFTGSEENGKLNLKPNAAITRQDFAVVFARTLDLVDAETPVDASIKAINATTVEVTLDKEIDNLDDHKFEIAGLEIKNKAVKQSNKNVVVLTTAVQEAGKEYTVSLDGEEIGKFKGVEAVLPEKVSFVTESIQGIYGQQVTVSAKVTVKEGQSPAGIPVTFNIDSNADAAGGQFAKDYVAEAVTNAEGVATYTYTQYNPSNSKDTVTVYATGKANVRAYASVYWGNEARLTVKDVTEGSTIANSNTKVYKVTSKENKNGYVAVTFKENVGVTPDKVTNGAKFTDANVYRVNTDNTLTNVGYNGVPFEVTTGGHQVALVKLNSNGEAQFTLTGADATVTPVVYAGVALDASGALATKQPDLKYDGTDLQATGSTVKFEVNQTAEISLVAKGSQKAAARNVNGGTGLGGREYTVTLKGKDGKVAPAGTTAYIYFDKASTGNSNSVDHSLTLTPVVDGKEGTAVTVNTTNSNRIIDAIPVTVNEKGEATFVVRGAANDYATPIAIYNNGKDNAVIDSSDAKATGEITYFGDVVVGASKVKITSLATGKEVTSIVGTDSAVIEYIAVDQNGFPYFNSTNAAFDSTFTFVDTFANYNVSGGTLVSSENNRKTYKVQAINGVAKLTVSSASKGTVSFTASTTNNILSAQSGSVTFNNLAEADTLTGTVKSVDTTNKKVTLVINGVDAELSYKDALLYYKGTTVGVDEDFFETKLVAGAKVTYNKATSTSKAKFNIFEDSPNITDAITKVNNALSRQEVVTALTGVTAYEKLSSVAKPMAVDAIWSSLQAGNTFTTPTLNTALTEGNYTITVTAAYTPAVANVPSVGAKATYTNSASKTFTVTAPTGANAESYNGIKVAFKLNTTSPTTTTTITSNYVTADKTLEIFLPTTVGTPDPITGVAPRSFNTAAALEFDDLATAFTTATLADGTTVLNTGGTLTAGDAITSDLVGKVLTLVDGVNGNAGAVNAKVALTFSEAITATTLAFDLDGTPATLSNQSANATNTIFTMDITQAVTASSVISNLTGFTAIPTVQPTGSTVTVNKAIVYPTTVTINK